MIVMWEELKASFKVAKFLVIQWSWVDKSKNSEINTSSSVDFWYFLLLMSLDAIYPQIGNFFQILPALNVYKEDFEGIPTRLKTDSPEM